MEPKDVLQLLIRLLFASVRAVLLVERHDVLELLGFLQLLSKEGLQEPFLRQRANIQDHVVPVVLELLEVVPLEVNIDEFIPFDHCAIFVG